MSVISNTWCSKQYNTSFAVHKFNSVTASSETYGEYNLIDNAEHQITVNKIPKVSH